MTKQKLFGEEEAAARIHLDQAALLAQSSGCFRRRCGALIWKYSTVGVGFNSPPPNGQCRCRVEKSVYHEKVVDKTCCTHAEVKAVLDGLRQRPDGLAGSVMYFTSVDGSNQRQFSGEPYCTLCSKLALEVGIAYWVLEHSDGIYQYEAGYYHELSYRFGQVK
jgi:deoxycytidylate deaminase